MRKNYLFPTTFRKIGWCLFVPFAITSFICLFDGSNEDWLKVNALSVIPWGIIKNSLFDELSMIGLTVSQKKRTKMNALPIFVQTLLSGLP